MTGSRVLSVSADSPPAGQPNLQPRLQILPAAQAVLQSTNKAGLSFSNQVLNGHEALC